MYLIVGTVGLVGLIFTQRSWVLAPFLDLPAFAIVAGGAFFATLAMVREIQSETVAFLVMLLYVRLDRSFNRYSSNVRQH